MGKFKRGKKKGASSYARLSDAQKAFIEDRVKKLGNLAAVKSIYRRGALVDRYAIAMAKKIYEEV